MLSQNNPPQLMGILNVTPDSFSDGGRYLAGDALAARIAELLADGADIIDVGGESSRPGASPVAEEEELARVLPAVEAIRRVSDIPVSIDTTKAGVARRALAAGANIVNDISALEMDADMTAVLRESGARVVLMHMQGRPRDMQTAPQYDDVVGEIDAYLARRIEHLEAAGIPRARMIVDPGLGFGKTTAHNLAILRGLETFTRHGCPLLIGHSRKRFLGDLTGIPTPGDRDPATALTSVWCANKGADILRVHNVAATRQALALWRALEGDETADEGGARGGA